jgi:signal transduction histidine kinase
MMQRRGDLKEPGYKGRLEISAEQKGKKMEIIMVDNGIGVKEEDMHKIFTPFFTTKLSSKKGTGLGMYVMQRIIEDNHQGKIEFTSNFKKGSQTKIILPVADGQMSG